MEMKVSEMLAARFSETQTVKEKVPQQDFSFTLKRLSDEGLAGRLQTLIGEITTQGKRLAEHVDFSDMKRYRSLITDFINEVVTHSHEFSRENYLNRRGQHRVFAIVRMVNQDLDDLAQELLEKEKDHIAILDKIDEIQGLLLDMIV
ncbi:MAG: YaaR family protein [Defluviitaleaceae bacterium]|nr:YaaR family protein [Defluviitaleaceae bacterium]MCL2240581.1 YaaR family protein [Defluviitaleaceae bacterium]